MLKYLFYTVPPMLFEALAITALIGFGVLLFLRKKKNPVLFWSLTGFVLFMIVWRLSVHSLMLSSRYAQIIIYPCVILSACLCMNTQALFRWIFCKLKLNFPYRKDICKFLPTVLFVSLFFACIGKALHVDSYGNFIEKITTAYQKYADSKDHIHIAESEHHRISWYLKRKISDVQVIHENNQTALSSVSKTVQGLKNFEGNHYLFFYLKKKETEPSARTMNFDKDSGSWEILERFYTSKRKHKEIILARYRPVCSNIKEWNKPIPELPADDILKVGNFEQIRAGAALKSLENYYKKNQIKGYCDLSKRKLPNGWWFVLGSWNKDNPPEINLTETNPLAGKYSLQLDARPPLSPAIFSGAYFNKPCRYTFFVRGGGKQSSQVQINAYFGNIKEKKYTSRLWGKFLIHPGKVYRIDGEVPYNKFPQGFQNFCLQFVVRGYVTVDQISATPLKK